MKKSKNLKARGTNDAARPALTKRDLVVQIARESGQIQETVYQILQLTLDGIADALVAGRHIEFREFGVFELTTRKSRIGRNPNKPETVVRIPERKVVKFKPGKRLKMLLAKA